jgi:hypothetical protein
MDHSAARRDVTSPSTPPKPLWRWVKAGSRSRGGCQS